MEPAPRPRPLPTEETRPYWEGAQQGELRIQQCGACGRHQFYPRLLCTHCGSEQVGWVRATGRGRIYSYTVNHRPAGPAFASMVPYVVALVDLEEGARMMANLLQCAPEEALIGMEVEVVFEDIGEGMRLPQFKPAGDGATR